MNFKWVKVATVFLVALFLMAQTSPKTVTVIYAPSAPTTATCKAGQQWQNTTAGTLYGCNTTVNPTVWQQLGGGASTFPITATSGPTTVTLTGDAGAQTGSYVINNATEGAGWNAALGGALGASLFAFDADTTASLNIDLDNNTLTLSLLDGANEVISRLGTNETEITVTTATTTTSQAIQQGQIIHRITDGVLVSETSIFPTGMRDFNQGAKPTCSISTQNHRWYERGGSESLTPTKPA